MTPVTPEQGQAVASRMGAMYIECSAKENNGVQEVFDLAINTAVRAEDENYEKPVAATGSGLVSKKKAKKRTCKIL